MDFDFSQIQYCADSGLDGFLGTKPKVAAASRKKVASLAVLANFERVSEDFLVHKSSQDLWSLGQDSEGFFIERLFQSDGSPLRR